MSARKVIVTVLLTLGVVTVSPATASGFQYTIVPNHRMSPANVQRIEHAVSFQVNIQEARYYRVNPVSFVPTGGIPIDLVSGKQAAAAFAQGGPPLPAGTQVLGFHTPDPQIVVWGQDFKDTAITISHEVLETEADPLVTNQALEIADPVEAQSYKLWGVPVSDWVLPNGRGFLRKVR